MLNWSHGVARTVGRSNQRILERQNEMGLKKGWEDIPGPNWAWGLSFLPVVGEIGLIVIAVAAWRRERHPRRDSN